MTLEVTVRNPAYWVERAPQLAQLLKSAETDGAPSTVGDPTGKPPDPDNLLVITDPGHWAKETNELREILAVAQEASPTGTGDPPPGSSAGAVPASQERLTMTVEEAAAALGISRAFAYEACHPQRDPAREDRSSHPHPEGSSGTDVGRRRGDHTVTKPRTPATVARGRPTLDAQSPYNGQPQAPRDEQAQFDDPGLRGRGQLSGVRHALSASNEFLIMSESITSLTGVRVSAAAMRLTDLSAIGLPARAALIVA